MLSRYDVSLLKSQNRTQTKSRSYLLLLSPAVYYSNRSIQNKTAQTLHIHFAFDLYPTNKHDLFGSFPICSSLFPLNTELPARTFQVPGIPAESSPVRPAYASDSVMILRRHIPLCLTGRMLNILIRKFPLGTLHNHLFVRRQERSRVPYFACSQHRT